MRNELIADYTLLNEYPSMNEKKALAAKYGIESKKAKEIQEMVLVAMRGERKTRTEFDEIDLRYFSRFDIPETYAKAVPYYELESIEFLNYVLNVYWGNVVEKKLENKLSLANSRGYGICAAHKYIIKRYLNLKRYLEEIKPENIEKKRSDEEINNVIRNILLVEMKPLHDNYIERITAWAKKSYVSIIKTKTESAKELDLLPKDVNYNIWKPIKNKYDRAVALLRRFDTIDKYVAYTVESAEREYMNDVNEVTLRIRKKELDYDKIKVINVYNDPKFFELTITDGNKSLHARSIWAAEYSEKVTAHYRFIIT
jgi:hypothetical protein